MKTIDHNDDTHPHVIEQLNFNSDKIEFYAWDKNAWEREQRKDDYRVATFKVIPTSEPLELRLARRHHILHLQNHIS